MSLLLTMLTVLSANLIGIESQWRSPLGGATVAYFLIRSVDWRVSLWRRLWINTGRRWNFSWTCLFIAEWYNFLLFVFFLSAMGFISDIGRTKFSALFLSNVSRGFSLFCLLVIISCQQSKCTYLNQIAVHIEGGSHIADRIATKHGYTNMGQVCIPIIVICHTYYHEYCLLGWDQ